MLVTDGRNIYSTRKPVYSKDDKNKVNVTFDAIETVTEYLELRCEQQNVYDIYITTKFGIIHFTPHGMIEEEE